MKEGSLRKISKLFREYFGCLRLLLGSKKFSPHDDELNKIVVLGWELIFRFCVVGANVFFCYLLLNRLGISEWISLILCGIPYLVVCKVKNEI